MKLKSKKFTRPVVTPFPEEADPVGLARTVAKEYRAMEDGHHAHLRAFLGRAYQVYRLFQQAPSSYEKLKQDPFWENSRQKPKGLTTSKHVLLFIMRAESRNARTRASTYAKILNGFARKRVRADQVPKRIAALGGVENAYDYFLAIERGLKSGGDVDDEATDNQRPLISRKGGLRTARRSNDDQVQGDAEGESPSENGHGIAIGGRRHMPPFDRERDLIVENKPDVLKAILDAGTAQGGPVRLPLTITVYPCDATGFVRVVGELESSDLPEDFSSIDDEDGPSHTRPFNEKRAPPPLRPKRSLRKGKPKVRPWEGRPTSIFAK